MKFLVTAVLFSSFALHASPLMSMKERLRLHMWTFGLEDKPVKKAPRTVQKLPEELERPLRKI